MSALRSKVARLALDSPGQLRDLLVPVLREAGSDDVASSEETDAEGKFEKGKKVPVSQLPQELQDNVQNPPVAVQELKDDLKNKTASLDGHTLDQLVEMAAEANGVDNPRDAHATRAVHQAANRFDRAVSKALSVFVQKYPPATGDVDAMMSDNAVYLTFMTLEGHGVGLWDGRFSDYYPDTKNLERFMRRAVLREYRVLAQAIEDAAFETAGEDS